MFLDKFVKITFFILNESPKTEHFINRLGAVGKFCSFGFAEGLALCVGAKPNVQNVRWQKKFNFFSCGGVFLFF